MSQHPEGSSPDFHVDEQPSSKKRSTCLNPPKGPRQISTGPELQRRLAVGLSDQTAQPPQQSYVPPPPVQQFTPQDIADAMARTARQMEIERQRGEQMARDMAPPEIPDPDALITSPQALMAALRSYADWGARRALASMAPVISQTQQAALHANARADAIASLAPGFINAQSEMALDKAHDRLKAQGMSEEEFQQLLPLVDRVIAGAPDQSRHALRTDPNHLTGVLSQSPEGSSPDFHGNRSGLP